MRAWAAANPERVRERQRAWNAENPERVREHKRNAGSKQGVRVAADGTRLADPVSGLIDAYDDTRPSR